MKRDRNYDQVIMSDGMKYLLETTEELHPHIYIFDDSDRCIGYQNCLNNEVLMFKKPSVQFSKRYRKFKKVDKLVTAK